MTNPKLPHQRASSVRRYRNFNALIIRVWPGAAQSATGPTNMPPVATPEGLARNADRRLKGGRRLSAPVQQREGEQSQSINRRRDQ